MKGKARAKDIPTLAADSSAPTKRKASESVHVKTDPEGSTSTLAVTASSANLNLTSGNRPNFMITSWKLHIVPMLGHWLACCNNPFQPATDSESSFLDLVQQIIDAVHPNEGYKIKSLNDVVYSTVSLRSLYEVHYFRLIHKLVQ